MSLAGRPKEAAQRAYEKEIAKAKREFERDVAPARMDYMRAIRPFIEKRDKAFREATDAWVKARDERRKRDDRKRAKAAR